MALWNFYHNPQCSKSREALEILKAQGADFKTIEYLKSPLTTTELSQLLEQLESPISSLVRVKEKGYLEAPFDVNSPEEVVRQLSKKPRLMERPILQGKGRAVIGRPLEKLEALLKS